MITKAIAPNGDFIDIEVAPNGAACRCTCPNCGELLIAKNNGTERQHHFAHAFKERDCGYINYLYETTPQTLQELLKIRKRLACFNGFKYYYITKNDKNEIIYHEAQIIENKFNNKIKNFIPAYQTTISESEKNKRIWQIYPLTEEDKKIISKLQKKEERKKIKNINIKEEKLLILFRLLSKEEQNKIIEDCQYFANKHVELDTKLDHNNIKQIQN